MVDVFALDSERVEILTSSALENVFSDLGQVSFDIESESTEFPNVNRLALAQLLFDIGD